MPSQTAKMLEQATLGLLYPSESDEPFQPVLLDCIGDNLDERQIVTFLEKPGAKVSEITLSAIFNHLTEDQSWHDEQDQNIVNRYRQLLAVLQRQLTNIHVFKVGETEIDILIVGRTSEGSWEGLKTKSIET